MAWIHHDVSTQTCPHLNLTKNAKCEGCWETIYEFVSSDPLVEYMKKHDIPVTRENYLSLAYLGNPPAELGPELEAELPSELTDEEDDNA
jgi:hypothetical protein